MGSPPTLREAQLLRRERRPQIGSDAVSSHYAASALRSPASRGRNTALSTRRGGSREAARHIEASQRGSLAGSG